MHAGATAENTMKTAEDRRCANWATISTQSMLRLGSLRARPDVAEPGVRLAAEERSGHRRRRASRSASRSVGRRRDASLTRNRRSCRTCRRARVGSAATVDVVSSGSDSSHRVGRRDARQLQEHALHDRRRGLRAVARLLEIGRRRCRAVGIAAVGGERRRVVPRVVVARPGRSRSCPTAGSCRRGSRRTACSRSCEW